MKKEFCNWVFVYRVKERKKKKQVETIKKREFKKKKRVQISFLLQREIVFAFSNR